MLPKYGLNKRKYGKNSDGRSILEKFFWKNSNFLKLTYLGQCWTFWALVCCKHREFYNTIVIKFEFENKINVFDQRQFFRGAWGGPRKEKEKRFSSKLRWIYQPKKSSIFNCILLTLNKKHLTFLMIWAIIAPPPLHV